MGEISSAKYGAPMKVVHEKESAVGFDSSSPRKMS